jgi:hypothetical protein
VKLEEGRVLLRNTVQGSDIAGALTAAELASYRNALATLAASLLPLQCPRHPQSTCFTHHCPASGVLHGVYRRFTSDLASTGRRIVIGDPQRLTFNVDGSVQVPINYQSTRLAGKDPLR